MRTDLRNVSLKPIKLLVLASMYATAGWSQVVIDPSGDFESKNYVYTDDTATAASASDLHIKLKATDSLGAGVYTWMRVRQSYHFPETGVYAQVKECYVKLPFKKMDVSVGKQIYAWGVADGSNPTNYLTPADYSDLAATDREQFGAYSASVKTYIANTTLECAYVPFPEAHTLPRPQTRWFPDVASRIDMVLPDGVTGIGLNVSDPGIRNDGRANEFAARWSATVRTLDFSASYYNGYCKYPFYSISPQGIDGQTMMLNLQFDYFRQQALGADLVFVPKGLVVLKAEAAYYQFASKAPEESYVRYVAGVEKSFSLIGNTVTSIIQYLDDIPVDGAFADNSLLHAQDNSVIGTISVKDGVSWAASVKGVASMADDGCLLQPSIKYYPFDNAVITAGYDLLTGSKKGFWGQFDRNTRMVLSFAYSY